MAPSTLPYPLFRFRNKTYFSKSQESFLGYIRRRLATPSKAWNDDSGDWRGLSSESQTPRYQHIAKLIEDCAAKRVLDVGCGEALLKRFLPQAVAYLGIEPSAKALNERHDIVHSTAEDFAASGDSRWDCIVFNEVLYYSRDPLYLLRHYAQFLPANGTIIVSIYQRAASRKERLLQSVFRHRPPSNLDCSEIVREFIERQRWTIESEELINQRWRVWMARTRQD